MATNFQNRMVAKGYWILNTAKIEAAIYRYYYIGKRKVYLIIDNGTFSLLKITYFKYFRLHLQANFFIFFSYICYCFSNAFCIFHLLNKSVNRLFDWWLDKIFLFVIYVRTSLMEREHGMQQTKDIIFKK